MPVPVKGIDDEQQFKHLYTVLYLVLAALDSLRSIYLNCWRIAECLVVDSFVGVDATASTFTCAVGIEFVPLRWD